MKNTTAFLVGLISGITMPLIFGFVFFTITYHGVSPMLKEVKTMCSYPAVATKVLILILFIDMGAVFFLNHYEKWMMLRGLFVAIILYIVLAIMFLL